jgi:hypothetical protein
VLPMSSLARLVSKSEGTSPSDETDLLRFFSVAAMDNPFEIDWWA